VGKEPAHDVVMTFDQCIDKFSEVFEEYESDLSEYFRSVGNVLYAIEQIETSNLTADIQNYTSTFKMSLNGVETALIYYYLKMPEGSRHFRSLVVRMHRRLMNKYQMTEYVTDSYLSRSFEGNPPR
jgi:hypothetical protein